MRWNTPNTSLANAINNGNTFINGEVLTAPALNAITQEMFRGSDLMRMFFGISLIDVLLNGHTISWSRQINHPRTTTLTTTFASFPVFVQVRVPGDLTNRITASSAPINNGFTVTVTETSFLNSQPLNGTSVFHLDFDFYSDAGRSNLIMRRNIRINYIVPPGQGND